MSGLEAVQHHSKLMVLGKPGAGKTTFLKYLAMQCIEGQFQVNRVPLFITLKDFAEAPKQLYVLEYIAQQLSSCGVRDATIRAEQLLRQGRALMLLDGLDEVREEDTKRVLKQIEDFSAQFHTNQVVITCRIAAKDYTFERFTEVEVADFDKEQIAIFAQNWFRLSDPVKAERFIQKLEENEPIQELAASPLLLTLLCLVFGETADFPINRSELYKEGLDVLLKKWDAKRNIERDQVYKNLSVQRKEDLLSQIALITFEQKDYFFKQKIVGAYIADFIRNLRDADPDPEALKLDSEAVLKSIEAQHGLLVERAKGIYSFSHLTFHEYFAAREIVANSAYKSLVEHITETRWREVFLLTVGMMRNADNLLWLMKQKIDNLAASDAKIQIFLDWLDQKTQLVKAHYKPVSIRAFYLSMSIKFAYDYSFAKNIEPALRLEPFNNQLDIDRHLSVSLDLACMGSVNCLSHFARIPNLAFDIDIPLWRSLLELKEELPYYAKSWLKSELRSTDVFYFGSPRYVVREEKLNYWLIGSAQKWIEQLRTIMIEHRNIGHDWQFSTTQKHILRQYYDANRLLVDCLNSDCYVSREVRQEIEETLLLPMSEIEKRLQDKLS